MPDRRTLFLLLGGIGIIAAVTINLKTGGLVARVAGGLPFLAGGMLVPELLVRRVTLRRGVAEFAVLVGALTVLAGAITGLAFAFAGTVPFYTVYFGTDLLTMLWIPLAVLAFHESGDMAERRRIWRILVTLGIVTIGATFARLATSNALTIFLFGVGWFHFLLPALVLAGLCAHVAAGSVIGTPGRLLRLILLTAAIVFLAGVYGLGYQRASLVAFAAMLIVSAALCASALGRRFLGAAGMALGGIITLIVLVVLLGERFQDTRFYELTLHTSLVAEGSTMARVLEARDALVMLASNLPFSLLGFGHGASYIPEASHIATNVTPEGVVHNIHIGPVLLLFRYGLLGAVFYGLVWWLLWRGFWLLRRLMLRCAAEPPRIVDLELFAASYLLLLASFARFHAQNTLIDPMFGISFALTLAMVRVYAGAEGAEPDAGEILTAGVPE